MNMTAIAAAPRTETKGVSALDVRYDKDSGQWRRHSFEPASGFNVESMDYVEDLEQDEGSEHETHRSAIAKFFAYFSGPIVWAMEIATVLLIIAFHSEDFVSDIVVANLIIMVMTMAFRASFGFWHESHPHGSDEALNRHVPSWARSHHR